MATRFAPLLVICGLITVVSAYDGVLNFQVMAPPLSLLEKTHQAIVDVWQHVLSMEPTSAVASDDMITLMQQALTVHTIVNHYVDTHGAIIHTDVPLVEDTLFLVELLRRLQSLLEQKNNDKLCGVLLIVRECEYKLLAAMHNAT